MKWIKLKLLVIISIHLILIGGLSGKIMPAENKSSRLGRDSSVASSGEDKFEKTVQSIIKKNKKQSDYEQILDKQKPRVNGFVFDVLRETYRNPLKAAQIWEGKSDDISAVLANQEFSRFFISLAAIVDIQINYSAIEFPSVPSKEAGWPEHLSYLKNIFAKARDLVQDIHNASNFTACKGAENGMSARGAPMFGSAMPPETKEKLFNSAIMMTVLLNRNYLGDLLNCLKNTKFEPVSVDVNTATGNILYLEETSFGRIIIGGVGKNTYKQDAVLLIDIGGDDTYLNNAGATTENIAISWLVDFEGNDTYQSEDNVAQGTGVCGVGYLLDLKGNDVYKASGQAQGCGIDGVGWLIDLAGNDKYTGDSYNQGSAPNGIGLLTDFQGDDQYVSFLGAQGFGKSNGVGLLVDLAGNDAYKAGFKYLDPVVSRQQGDPGATVSHSQGFGEYNGVGILLELAGNDIYEVEYFGQGSGYKSFGFLRDFKGNDKYSGRRYTQGQGVHNAIGILIDDDGNDNYTNSKNAGQGAAFDHSLGILYDKKGKNVYSAGDSGDSQGAGLGLAFGFLIDLTGKTDSKGKSRPYDTILEPGLGVALK